MPQQESSGVISTPAERHLWAGHDGGGDEYEGPESAQPSPTGGGVTMPDVATR